MHLVPKTGSTPGGNMFYIGGKHVKILSETTRPSALAFSM